MEDEALLELGRKIAKDAEKLGASMPPAMASLSVLMIAGEVIQHMHEYGERLPPETMATLNLAAAMLHYCSHLFPPMLNIDGSTNTPIAQED